MPPRPPTDLARATFDRIAAASLANAERNRQHITRSVRDLTEWEVDRVLVVANGPSLNIPALAKLDLGAEHVVCVDGVVAKLVAAGVYPNLVVTCDPHARIAHWFGAEPDEHFRRTGEATVHVDAGGLTVAIATAAHVNTTRLLAGAGARLHWFHAMLDDPSTEGLTRRLYDANPLPVVNGGGNVGTAAWVIAHSILGAKDVALVGFDFGYPPGFPPERTQYAPELRELYGEKWLDAFVRYPSGWYADPAFAWFRDVFLEMAATAPCRTVNCTEGGTLDGLERMTLETWLAG